MFSQRCSWRFKVLGIYTASSRQFKRIAAPLFRGRLRLLDPEDEGTTKLQTSGTAYPMKRRKYVDEFHFQWQERPTVGMWWVTTTRAGQYNVSSGPTVTCYSLPVTWCTNSSTFNSCTFCPHCVYVFCIYLRTNSDLCHLQHKVIGFLTEMKSVYCAVRPGSLNKAVCASYLKG